MLWNLLAFLLQIVFVIVVLTFILRYYEWRNTPLAEREDEVEKVAPALAGAIGFVWEYLCTLFVVVLYPFGWLSGEGEVSATLGEHEQPVLLVTGILGNSGAFWYLRRSLRKRGHENVFTVDIGPLNGGLHTFSELIDERVREVTALTGKSRLDVIAFGFGGLAARWYARHGGAAKIKNLVLIGTPNQGTRLAALTPGKGSEYASPASEGIRQLSENVTEELAAGPRYMNIYSTFDNAILPPNAAHLEGAENYRLAYLGHTALLFSSQVADKCSRIIDGEPAAAAKNYSREFPNG